jgi:hypothetical protein
MSAARRALTQRAGHKEGNGMVLDIARVVNLSFGVIVGACLIGGLIAGLFGGGVDDAAEIDLPDWHEDW